MYCKHKRTENIKLYIKSLFYFWFFFCSIRLLCLVKSNTSSCYAGWKFLIRTNY